MKIQIEITKTEENGIIEYLKEVYDIKKPNKKDLQNYFNNLIQIIHSPKEAVSYYIKKNETNET